MPNTLYIPSENALQMPSDVARALTNNVLGAYKHLKLPIGFALPDAAVLFTVPTLPNGCGGTLHRSVVVGDHDIVHWRYDASGGREF